MYWLQRPPYLRRIAAAAVLLAAVAWDLRPAPTERRPFASEDTQAGAPIAIEWREVPSGVLPEVDPAGAVAAADLAAGTPLVPGLLTAPAAAPAGWPSVPLDIGPARRTGDRLLLVVTDPPLTTEAVVVEPQRGDAYGFDHSPALVAVPPDTAVPIVAAERAGTLVVAVAPAG